MDNFVPDPVSLHVWNCLHNYAFDEATFAAERLHAETNTSESLYLLATCLYRSGRPKQACLLLCSKLSTLPRNKLLLARCYFDIGQVNDAKKVLITEPFSNMTKKLIEEEYAEQSCFVFQLLGDVYNCSRDLIKASKCYEACLLNNPMMWSCFEKLCKINVDADPKKYFRLSSSVKLNSGVINQPELSKQPGFVSHDSNFDNIMSRENINPSKPGELSAIEKVVMCDVVNTNQRVFIGQNNMSNIHNSPFHTPENAYPNEIKHFAPKSIRKDLHNFSSFEICTPPSPLFACVPVFSRIKNRGPSRLSFTDSFKLDTTTAECKIKNDSQIPSNTPYLNRIKITSTPAHPKQENETGPNLRPRTRLQLNKAISSTPVLSDKKSVEISAENTKDAEKMEEHNENILDKTETFVDPRISSATAYLNFLQQLGKIYALLNQFECKESAELLAKIPAKHLATTRLLTWAASCHMHVGEYKVAKRLFQEARSYEPWQLFGMDLYSTVLWHLKDEVSISALAHELFTLDQNAAELWCVAGNCFSLHRETHIAIKFFQQALKANPNHAYAAALLGHEFMVNHNMDLALSAFQHALSLDSRLYSAMFGISNVYFSQEQYREAETHLVAAVRTFHRSSDLLTHLGVVRAKLGWYGIPSNANGNPDEYQNTAKEIFDVDEKSLEMDRRGSALHCFNLALMLNPRCYQARFHRACLLYSLRYLALSIDELNALAEENPRESNIHILIGNAYNRLGQFAKAQIHFTKAVAMERLSAGGDVSSGMGLNGFHKERVGPRLLLADLNDDELDTFNQSRSMVVGSQYLDDSVPRSGDIIRVPRNSSQMDLTAPLDNNEIRSDTSSSEDANPSATTVDNLPITRSAQSTRRMERAAQLSLEYTISRVRSNIRSSTVSVDSPSRSTANTQSFRWTNQDRANSGQISPLNRSFSLTDAPPPSTPYSTRSRRRLSTRRNMGTGSQQVLPGLDRWDDLSQLTAEETEDTMLLE